MNIYLLIFILPAFLLMIEAAKNDLHINKSQTLNHSMIGIDRRKLKILSVNGHDGALKEKVIDLKNVAECSVQNEINPSMDLLRI